MRRIGNLYDEKIDPNVVGGHTLNRSFKLETSKSPLMYASDTEESDSERVTETTREG